jgi:hypothetical protein
MRFLDSLSRQPSVAPGSSHALPHNCVIAIPGAVRFAINTDQTKWVSLSAPIALATREGRCACQGCKHRRRHQIFVRELSQREVRRNLQPVDHAVALKSLLPQCAFERVILSSYQID